MYLILYLQNYIDVSNIKTKSQDLKHISEFTQRTISSITYV